MESSKGNKVWNSSPNDNLDNGHSTNKDIVVSSQCKACKKDFTKSSILRHISHKVSCKGSYSSEEIQLFRIWKKRRNEEGRQRHHDPVKRRQRYIKDKQKYVPGSPIKTFDKKQPIATENSKITTRCRSCEVVFTTSTIFQHISHSSSCKNFYSEEDLQKFDEWTKDRAQENKILSYDSDKRKQRYKQNKAKIAKKYYENISKYKEKPRDRESLKGKSFVAIFKKAFDNACANFKSKNLTQQVNDFIVENYYKEIYDQTLSSKFWKTPLHSSSQDDLAIEPENIEKIDKKVKESICNISEIFAWKSWNHPMHQDFMIKHRINLRYREIFYKEAFEFFFHNESFLHDYNKTFHSCRKIFMKSKFMKSNVHGVTLSDIGILNLPFDKNSNRVFEEEFLEVIAESSKEGSMKNMSDFLQKEIEKIVTISEKQKQLWKNWFVEAKKTFGHNLVFTSSLDYPL